MSERHKKIHVGLRKTSRPLLESLDIPPLLSARPPSRITITSQTCSRSETPRSGNLSRASSNRKLACSSQTCSSSPSCMKTNPDLCSHGLKEIKKETSQCSGTCHSHTMKISDTKIKITYIKRDSITPCGSDICPAALSSDEHSACSLVSPRASKDQLKTASGKKNKNVPSVNKQSDKKNPTLMKDDAKGSCGKRKHDVAETATHPNTDNASTGLKTKNVKSSKKDVPKDGSCNLSLCSPTLDVDTSSPPHGLTSLPVSPNKSCVIPDCQVPTTESKTLTNAKPVKKDQKKKIEKKKVGSDSCACPETDSPPPVQKKCSCHFPPAFNQFGCTGNITGNCNCASHS